MNKIIFYFIICLGTIAQGNYLQAQIWNKLSTTKKTHLESVLINKDNIPTFKRDIDYLTSNITQGRKAGTKGEEIAGIYIENRMKQLGLTPVFDNSFRQHFRIETNKRLSRESRFIIGNSHIFIPEQAFPLAFSAQVDEENYAIPGSKEPNAPWIIPLYDTESEAKNPNFEWEKVAYAKAINAQARGASSVIFYDAYGAKNAPIHTTNSNYSKLDILVAFVHKEQYEKHIKPLKVITPISINIDYTAETTINTNIVGKIDNKASKTIVFTGFYDHLGTTKFTNGVSYFPGADKGASSIATLLMLAERLKRYITTDYNFVFVAASGHYNANAGSKAFLKNFKKPIAYSINLDAVGKLAPNNKLNIEGIGSSNIWSGIINNNQSSLILSATKNYVSKSEAVNFYLQKTPALLITTGPHTDHGTVGDIPSKINYDGMVEITNYILKLIDQSKEYKNSEFTLMSQESL